jgi:hypothetical protein
MLISLLCFLFPLQIGLLNRGHSSTYFTIQLPIMPQYFPIKRCDHLYPLQSHFLNTCISIVLYICKQANIHAIMIVHTTSNSQRLFGVPCYQILQHFLANFSPLGKLEKTIFFTRPQFNEVYTPGPPSERGASEASQTSHSGQCPALALR